VSIEKKSHDFLRRSGKALTAKCSFAGVIMRCPDCGMKILFVGNTCPYCEATKAKKRQRHLSAALFGLCGGFVGWLFTQEMGLINHLGYTLLSSLMGAAFGVFLELSGVLSRR
jgi:hypothetical protein